MWDKHRGTQVALRIAQDESPVELGNFKNGFASVIDPALPAVVNISSTKVVQQQNVPNVFNDPFFRQFFGNQPGMQQQQPQKETEHSLGSGVIVNPDGYILTNNHVVAGASDVEVFTTTRRQYKANVIGTDPRTDIAVLKIDASGLPTFTLGDSSKLKVGDLVFAIGDPFGIGETATTGIVSATGRALGGATRALRKFHSNGRGDQPWKLRRRADRSSRKSDRDQYGDSFRRKRWESGHRLRNSGQHGAQCHGTDCSNTGR